MAEEAIKRRLKRAKDSALSGLFIKGYDAILSDGNIFNIIAVKRRKVRFIRLTTDKIEDCEWKIVRSFATSSKTISREIWTRKFRKKNFEITIIN